MNLALATRRSKEHCRREGTHGYQAKDKLAIVTGGARGIGAAFCEGLAEAGAKVVVSDVLDGSPVAERIGERQRSAIYVRADVTSKASSSLVADTVREFGTVDILVNNAGLFADLAVKPFLNIDEDQWDRVMKVNVRGTFQRAKAVAPVMMEKRRAASSTSRRAPRSRVRRISCTMWPQKAP